MKKLGLLVVALFLSVQAFAALSPAETDVLFEKGRSLNWPADITAKLTAEANAGNSEAQYCLGVQYRNGFGVAKDHKEAVKWYSKSAELNNPNGMDHLISMLEAGNGVLKNIPLAVKWTHRAAELNSSNAQLTLADRYLEGNGVKRNEMVAYAFYVLAGRDLASPAVRWLARDKFLTLSHKLTVGQLGQGERLARELIQPGQFQAVLSKFLKEN